MITRSFPRRAASRKSAAFPPRADLFAITLTDALNEVARQGWEYLRAESMPSESPRGWFRKSVRSEQTVLVFRRSREHLSPRIATGEATVPDPGSARQNEPAIAADVEPPLSPFLPPDASETPLRTFVQRQPGNPFRNPPGMRREPRVEPRSEPSEPPLQSEPLPESTRRD